MRLDGYADWLIGRGLDDKTIRLYTAKVTAVMKLCGTYGWDLDELTATQARIIANTFPNSPSTKRQLRTCLKHYWAMIGVYGPYEAIRVPRAPRGRYRGLEPDDAKRLAKTAVGWWPDGTAVLTAMYLGARRSEVAALSWTNFDRGMRWVTIHGKHNTIRCLPVHPRLRQELAPHMSAFPAVFPGSRGRTHVNPATVWNWVQRVADAAGVGDLTPHQLRHTAIATINDATGDLRAAQDFAGHARPETTAIYTRTTEAKMMMAVEALDYLDDC